MILVFINMISRMILYSLLMGIIDWISKNSYRKPAVEDIIQTFPYRISTVFILFAIAFGVAFPVVVGKSYIVKGKDLNFRIKKLFIRNN